MAYFNYWTQRIVALAPVLRTIRQAIVPQKVWEDDNTGWSNPVKLHPSQLPFEKQIVPHYSATKRTSEWTLEKDPAKQITQNPQVVFPKQQTWEDVKNRFVNNNKPDEPAAPATYLSQSNPAEFQKLVEKTVSAYKNRA